MAEKKEVGKYMQINTLHNIDCFEGHKQIEDSSIDLIYTDLPFNQTRNEWDCAIDLEQLWKDYKRIIKPNGIIVLHAQGMFSAKLMLSNEKWWRYNLVWKKGERTSGFLNAKKQPLRNHEDIIVMYNKPGTYNVQMTLGTKSHSRGNKGKVVNNNYGKFDFIEGESENGDMKYPKSILDFDRPHPPIHPTQKPVELAEWIIKTYSNEGDIILDSTSGSGTIPIACIKTNRNWIAFETDKNYFELANGRIKEIYKG